MDEVWRPLPLDGYEGEYQVSSLGRVRRTSTEFIRKHKISNRGYAIIQIWNHSIYKMINVHRMVALAFIDNPNCLREVNHIDGDKLNNHVSNLEWVSRSGNLKHYYKFHDAVPLTEDAHRRLCVARKRAWDEGKYANRKPRRDSVIST